MLCPWEGTYPEKGDMDVQQTRPLFHAPQPLQKTPYSAYYSSTRPPFKIKITKFSNFLLKIPKFGNFSCSKAWKSAKIQFRESKFGVKISSESEQFVKKSVQQAPKFAADPLYKPTKSQTYLPKPKLSTPPPGLCHEWVCKDSEVG